MDPVRGNVANVSLKLNNHYNYIQFKKKNSFLDTIRDAVLTECGTRYRTCASVSIIKWYSSHHFFNYVSDNLTALSSHF